MRFDDGGIMQPDLRQHLIEQAKAKPPLWVGDLEDDCSAEWGGLLLRAEWMDGKSWWWAVREMPSGQEIESSNDDDFDVDSGLLARRLAESAACGFLGISCDYNNG